MSKTSILLLLSFVSLFPAQSQNLNTPENFPDPKFRGIVAGLVGKPVDGIFTQEDLNTIIILNVWNRDLEDLTGIELMPNLEELDCSLNRIRSLDLSKNSMLVEARCGHNSLTRLNVSNLPRLKLLFVTSSSHNLVTELDLTASTELEKLDFEGNRVDYMDVSHCTQLQFLVCRGNKLKSLIVSPEAPLKYVLCSYNELTNIASLAENPTIGLGGKLDLTNNNLDCDDMKDVEILLERIGPPQWGYIMEKTASRETSSTSVSMQLDLSQCRPKPQTSEIYELNSGFGYCPQNNLESFDCLSGVEGWEVEK